MHFGNQLTFKFQKAAVPTGQYPTDDLADFIGNLQLYRINRVPFPCCGCFYLLAGFLFLFILVFTTFQVLSIMHGQSLEFLHNTIHKPKDVVLQKMIPLCFFLHPPAQMASAAFTGKCHAIGAPIASLTMPFPPIPAGAAFHAVPCATVLNNLIPAKRVPICLSTF